MVFCSRLAGFPSMSHPQQFRSFFFSEANDEAEDRQGSQKATPPQPQFLLFRTNKRALSTSLLSLRSCDGVWSSCSACEPTFGDSSRFRAPCSRSSEREAEV